MILTTEQFVIGSSAAFVMGACFGASAVISFLMSWNANRRRSKPTILAQSPPLAVSMWYDLPPYNKGRFDETSDEGKAYINAACNLLVMHSADLRI